VNTEKQIKALAELDGFRYLSPDTGLCYRTDKVEEDGVKCPDYLTSYDAIIPLIQKQSYATVSVIHSSLCDMNDTKFFLRDTTPAQLCEALLRATGKWEE